MGLIEGKQGWFNIQKSINATYCILRIKAFDKFQHIIKKRKATQQTRKRRKLTQHKKNIYEKFIAIILNGERLNTFSTSGTRQECHICHFYLTLYWGF